MRRWISVSLSERKCGRLPYIPDRGDCVWITFSPQAGHEQAGHRPGLVLSPISYNKQSGMAILCPLTNQIKGYSFEVVLPAGLPVTGAVLSDQVKNLDWQVRKATFICHLPASVVDGVLKKLKILL